MLTQFEHQGCTYRIDRPGPGEWVLRAYGMAFTDQPDMDLDDEFGADVTAWRQYINDIFVEVGFIIFSFVLERHVLVAEQATLEAEALEDQRLETELILQESRPDLFI